MPRAKVKRLILMSSLACLLTLVLFMLVAPVLDFGISVSAFQIAGGLLLGVWASDDEFTLAIAG